MVHAELLRSCDVCAKRTLFANNDRDTGTSGFLASLLEPCLDTSVRDCVGESLAELVLADAAEVHDFTSRIAVHLGTGHIEGRATSTCDFVGAIPGLCVERHLLGTCQASETCLKIVAVQDFALIILNGDIEDGVSEVDGINRVCLSHYVASI